MHAARGVQIRVHPGIRRQLNLDADPPGLRLGNNKDKDKDKGHPPDPPDPPGKSDISSTPPPPPPPPPAPVIPTTPANRNPTPTGYLEGGGDSRDSSRSTSSTTQIRTTTSTNPSPSASNYNHGSTAYGSGDAGVVNVGGGSSGSANGGLSSDLTPSPETFTSESTPPSTATNAGTSSNAKKGPSGGAVAGAVIVILLFLIGVLVFFLRRRSKTRRDEQTVKWGFTRNRTQQSYSDDEYLSFRNSHRSSFATTFDHSSASNHFPPILPLPLPLPPPMAEIGRHNGTSPSLVLDVNADQKRFSTGSAHSDNSQFLVVHHRQSQPDNWASVNECSEAFPFPKPPPVDSSSLHSRASAGSRALFQRMEEPEILYVASPGAIQPTNPISAPNQPTQPSLLPPLTNPFADNDPFGDPVPTEVQTVHRPFFAQLQDELQVAIGDSVRVVRSFDDGWALVEKLSPTSQSDLGLIPLECLRDVGGPSLLLGGKRLSSRAVEIPQT